MKEYTCEVVVTFSINNFEANNIEEYKEKVKQSFLETHGLEVMDSEIINIEEK